MPAAGAITLLKVLADAPGKSLETETIGTSALNKLILR